MLLLGRGSLSVYKGNVKCSISQFFDCGRRIFNPNSQKSRVEREVRKVGKVGKLKEREYLNYLLNLNFKKRGNKECE